MRMLFTTAPLRGHLYPMVPLAWAARAAGHDVLVATTEDFVAPALGAGLPAVAWGPPAGFAAAVAGAGTVGRHSAFAAAFAGIAARCLPGATALVRSWRPDLVVSERAEYAGPLAAAAAGVSRVTFHWGLAALPDYRAAAQEALGVDRLPEPALVLDPWPATMRPPRSAAHQDVRAVPYNGEARLVDDDLTEPARPRICVTLGTVLPALAGHRAELPALLAALAGLGADLVVAGLDAAVLADVPGDESSGGRVVRAGQVSLAHVLPHCSALVSHGGQGTVLTGLAAGCPQLVLPHLDDQFETAVAVSRRGAGRHLLPDEADPAAVADHCARLLADPTAVVAAAKVADEIAAQPAPARLVPVLEDQVGR